MPLSRRYSPEFAPGEICLFGMDFSFVLPPRATIRFADLKIFNNTVLAPDVSADFSIGEVMIAGSVVYARIAGGVDGTDYQFRWIVTDSEYNVWPRTALALCAQTS